MKFFSTFSQKYLEVIKKAVSLQRFREIEHIKLNEQMKGRLAQLVQSICLTSRGSAVRIRSPTPAMYFTSSVYQFPIAALQFVEHPLGLGQPFSRCTHP